MYIELSRGSQPASGSSGVCVFVRVCRTWRREWRGPQRSGGESGVQQNSNRPRIKWSTLWRRADARLCGSPVFPMVVKRSIRETKCAGQCTFLYVPIRRAIQLRRTSHTAICNILREQSSSRDRQCMRSRASQWHLHLYWHGARMGSWTVAYA